VIKLSGLEIRKIAINFVPVIASVLEIGCGDGNFARDLWIKGIRNYIGIDLRSDKIFLAKRKVRRFKFIRGNIFQHLDLFEKVDIIVAIEVFEHIRRDFDLLTEIPKGKKVIFSVPNSPYKQEHKRWYELDGWKERYNDFFEFENIYTVQNERKPTRRAFVFISTKK